MNRLFVGWPRVSLPVLPGLPVLLRKRNSLLQLTRGHGGCQLLRKVNYFVWCLGHQIAQCSSKPFTCLWVSGPGGGGLAACAMPLSEGCSSLSMIPVKHCINTGVGAKQHVACGQLCLVWV